MTDPLLSVFPPPLLRLILCGGDGLPAAYGPVAPIGAAALPWTLIHIEGQAVAMYPEWPAMHLTALPVLWRLPLDHWRARLALVAAWMLGDRCRAADVEFEPNRQREILHLITWRPTVGLELYAWEHLNRWLWSTTTGRDRRQQPRQDLLTLPAHLLTHDPAVALVLALYDVPEIRARLT